MDEGGRLWVYGRLAHVVSTPAGPVPPYGVEQRVEALPDLVAAAMVGVGPVGTQHVVVVVVPRNRQPRRRLGRLAPRLASPLAGHELAGRVRAVAGVPVAAVLLRDWLPVDIRHASKVDRTALAQWVTALLHGRVEARALARSTGRAPTTRSR
jgi:acyl-coenzyme A synthetase/AMP-(fatty) acid ligase